MQIKSLNGVINIFNIWFQYTNTVVDAAEFSKLFNEWLSYRGVHRGGNAVASMRPPVSPYFLKIKKIQRIIWKLSLIQWIQCILSIILGMGWFTAGVRNVTEWFFLRFKLLCPTWTTSPKLGGNLQGKNLKCIQKSQITEMYKIWREPNILF